MKKFRMRKAVAILCAIVMALLSFVAPATVYANQVDELEAEQLSTPAGLVLNRGHVEDLAFGGPMGVSWDEVDNRETFTVFVFEDDILHNPDEAYTYFGGIDVLYLDVNTAFSASLSNGPFWFRVQAQAAVDGFTNSALSDPVGPFWYSLHSDAFADNPVGSFALFADEDIPVIVIDTRRPIEREEQGNIVGDVHVPWPNAVAVEEGVTHADFQEGVLDAWQNFIENELTESQRQHLDYNLAYRDIHIFVY